MSGVLILFWLGTVLFVSGTFVNGWTALILLLPGLGLMALGIHLLRGELKRV